MIVEQNMQEAMTQLKQIYGEHSMKDLAQNSP